MTKSNSFEHILDKQILEKEEQDEEKSDEFWMNYVSNHVQSANHHVSRIIRNNRTIFIYFILDWNM